MTRTTLPARPTLTVLVAISMLQPIALNILAPSTPILARHFGASFATVQLALTLFLVAVALTQLVIGPLSDRFGRRPCVLLGIGLFATGSLLGAFAGSIGQLLLARALEGAGAGCAFALSRAIIRDTAGRDEAASQIATVTSVMVIAPMLSPYLGGQIETWLGWRGIFWFMTVFGAGVMVLSLARLPETAPNRGQRSPLLAVFRAFPVLIADRGFIVQVIVLSMTSAAFFGFVAAAPYIVVETMRQGPDVYGAFFILNAFGYMAGNFAMSRLAVRHGTRRMIRIGLMISAAATTAAFALSLTPYWTPLAFFLPLAFSAFGNGLTIPGATAEALSTRPELAGSAAGLTGALQLGAGALTTIAISWLVTLWPQALVAMMWAMMLVALAAIRGRGA